MPHAFLWEGSLVQLSQYLAETFEPLGNGCCACQGYSEQWQHHSNTWTARNVWAQAINYTVGLFCTVKRIIICEETAILCTYILLEGKETANKEGNTNRLRKGCPLFCRKHIKFFLKGKKGDISCGWGSVSPLKAVSCSLDACAVTQNWLTLPSFLSINLPFCLGFFVPSHEHMCISSWTFHCCQQLFRNTKGFPNAEI